MNIIDLKTTHIVLVHHYEIPLLRLCSGQNLQKFAATFDFQKADVIQDVSSGNAAAIQLRFGLFKSDDGEENAINKLNIEERKVIFELDGPSSYAREFYEELVSLITEYSKIEKDNLLDPIVIATESVVIAHLEIPISKLIAPEYLDFVQSTIPDLAKYDFAEARVVPFTLSFNVDFNVQSSYLEDHRIALSRKEFSIQPAIGYPLDEQVYFSKAPFDTNSHLQLLQDLETTLKKDL